jgi:hypothetical protein
MDRCITLSAHALIRPFILVCSCATAAASAAADVSEIELRRLFEPTASELAVEARGGIYIYEGLRDIDVQRAMDEQFDRVQYMMFIRTLKTDDTGEVELHPATGAAVTESDGC